MTVAKAYNLWCDHPECRDDRDAFDSDTWPSYQTAAEIRRAARKAGWRRTADGDDLCPEHPKGSTR